MAALSHSERVRLGLDDPPPEQEFMPGQAPAPGGAMQLFPPNMGRNARLAISESDAATAPRIRRLVNELLAGNMENADYALKQLFASQPKAALELYIELSKFSLPQLKAVAVQVDDRSDNPRAVGFAELQKMLTSD